MTDDELAERCKKLDTWFDRAPAAAGRSWDQGTRELCERAFEDGKLAAQATITAVSAEKAELTMELERVTSFSQSLQHKLNDEGLYLRCQKAETALAEVSRRLADLEDWKREALLSLEKWHKVGELLMKQYPLNIGDNIPERLAHELQRSR